MWFYFSYFIYSYLLLFDGIPLATTTVVKRPSSQTPLPTMSVNPRDIWNELNEVTEGSINADTRDKAPKHLFQPTSFLNPGYGVLFEHIGQLYQSVYKHYLIVGLKIPTLQHMPHEPEQWYEGCDKGLLKLLPFYEQGTLKQVFIEDYCAKDRFKQLYTDITKTIHSDIPALLPNQAIPYADLNFFNATPAPMAKNIYHPHHNNNSQARTKRDTSEDEPTLLPLLEVQRALDYFAKYGEPIHLDYDTIYAEVNRTFARHRQKRFLGALVRGITTLFKGGNIFGKIVSGIKKVGGFIFKGIKGLLHRKKNTALLHAAKAFAERSKRFLVGKLYKFRKFRGLHIARSSLGTTIKRTWHKTKFWMRNTFSRRFWDIINNYTNATAVRHPTWNHRAIVNYTNSIISFVNYRRESLFYLEKISISLHRLVFGLETLATGQLSTSLIPARLLHKFLHKILREVRHKHPQFVPLYTDLHHYYESTMNSYSNDKDHIFVQIPIFFVARSQNPMNLFRIHTVPVPLDIDTYEDKESKYTTLDLPYRYLATNGDEYMDISDAALAACHTYHMDHLCENLHLTTDVQELNCAIAIYMDSVETTSLQPAHIRNIIKTKCKFTYHELLYPTPTTLQTQDEILLANFPTDNWQLICDETTDRPSSLKGALYTIINLHDLCTCGVLTAQGRFLYESMRSCDNPDNKVQLHFTYNRALVNYDSTITAQDSKRYASKPYPFQAPDLQYYEHIPYLTSNGTLNIRAKRHVPGSDTYTKAMQVQKLPLPEAIQKMETQEAIYIGPILPSTETYEDSVEDILPTSFNNDNEKNVVHKLDTPLANLLFNVVTLINTLIHFCLIIFVRLSFKPGGWFYNIVFQMIQMSMIKPTKAVRLMEPLIPLPEEESHFLLDQPIQEETHTTDNPLDPLDHMDKITDISKILLILLAILVACITIWVTFRKFLLPLSYKSNIYRQVCLSCLHNSQTQQSPTTDIFLDVIHIHSGKQIRIYLTSITAPASALGFTGSVKLKNFKVLSRKFQIFVDIDWHNCLLLYNNFIIPLPERGTALCFQPNLLTDFTQQGPYNIVLLARHLDTMIQIPHVDNHDFMHSDDKLHFAIESPYKKIHDEVKSLMPLAPSVATTPNTIDSSKDLTVGLQNV